jgi:maltose alpha-D-glucosyltransferase/alpha-amylase
LPLRPERDIVSAKWIHTIGLLFFTAFALGQGREPWYKSSIIYTLDVEVFKDSDGNGIGDFNGLISRLGYIDSLGADAIWLSPFQPTPNQDDGYDISDFYRVDPRLGTMDDFQRFILRAKELQLRVIMDLVVNHTSDQHPWFKEARSSPQSKYRQWYVWSKERPANYNEGMVFPGVQKEIWTYDSTAGEYYYHRFYRFQPDLNTQYKPVWDEIKNIISFWMDKGITGFRLDGVPFVIEVPQKKGTTYPHQFGLLTDLRRHAESINPDAIILGEANVLPKEQLDFFGKTGDGLHMMFNFFVNQHIFYSLTTGSAGPLKDALRATKKKPRNGQWAQFLRNHDEVDLGRLSNKQRQQVYDDMGPSKNMQLYDRGIRRRLAPMLKNDSARIRMAYSLLLSLPSTPVIRYGDEIGMGDDLSLKERLSVRTPMQWDHSVSAGFSSTRDIVRPVVVEPAYDYHRVNVKDQQADSGSLLNWTRAMIGLRRSMPAIALGSWKILRTGTASALALMYSYGDKRVLVVHNLSANSLHINIRFKAHKRIKMDLQGYGYRWQLVP